jgi:endonuclease/exonuclease/phosphatase family metal-dependent hydrolase
MILSVVTYNDGDNRTTKADEVSKILSDVSPDIFGLQEVQEIHVPVYLEKTGDYACVYFDNDGTTYNSQPIFYNRSRFELVDSGIKWLSDTPDVKFSKYPESAYIRSCTYALLKEKDSNCQILAVNTHIDHSSEEARQLQIKRLFELIEGFKGLPTIFTGDFNTQPDSPVYRDVVESYFDDSFDVAKQAEKLPTFHGYIERNIIIDFVFVSRDCGIAVDKYDVLIKKYDGEYPSDHYPVLIEYSLN